MAEGERARCVTRLTSKRHAVHNGCCDFYWFEWDRKARRAHRTVSQRVCDLCRSNWDNHDRHKWGYAWWAWWHLYRWHRRAPDDDDVSPLLFLPPELAMYIREMLTPPTLPPFRCGHANIDQCRHRAYTMGALFRPGAREVMEHMRTHPERYGEWTPEMHEHVANLIPARPKLVMIPRILVEERVHPDNPQMVQRRMQIIPPPPGVSAEEWPTVRSVFFEQTCDEIHADFKRRRVESQDK